MLKPWVALSKHRRWWRCWCFLLTSPWWVSAEQEIQRRCSGGDYPPPSMGSLLNYPLVKSNWQSNTCNYWSWSCDICLHVTTSLFLIVISRGQQGAAPRARRTLTSLLTLKPQKFQTVCTDAAVLAWLERHYGRVRARKVTTNVLKSVEGVVLTYWVRHRCLHKVRTFGLFLLI